VATILVLMAWLAPRVTSAGKAAVRRNADSDEVGRF
jgi:hypothetical protein